MKKIIPVLLAILTLVSLLIIPANAASFPFTDVKTSDANYNAVKFLYDNSIINGVTKTEFRPNSELKRSQLVTILWRMSGSPNVSYTISFSDCIAGSSYYQAVKWACAEGITSGVTSTKFAPDSYVKYQDALVFLYRFAKYQGRTNVQDSDYKNSLKNSDLTYKNNFSDYAKPAAGWAYINGLIDNNNEINPLSSCLRGDIANYIYCLYVCRNVSLSAVDHNASNGDLPAPVTEVYSGNTYYFNFQTPELMHIKEAKLYIKEPGKTSFTKIHTETASNYLRYTDYAYTVSSNCGTGLLQYYWEFKYYIGSDSNITSDIKTNTSCVNVVNPINSIDSINSIEYPISCYTKNSTGSVITYTTSSLTIKAGSITCSTDECKIMAISGDAAKVCYPVAGGTKDAWCAISNFTSGTISAGNTEKAAKKLTTYRRNSFANSYGSIDANETYYVIYKNGDWKQVIYKLTAGGYKMGWINTNIDKGLVAGLEDWAKNNGFTPGTDAYDALMSINNRYGDVSVLKNELDAGRSIVFLFEGAGNDNDPSVRFNAMCVVVKNRQITFCCRNCSTIPDFPFSPSRNDGTDMPTIKAGIYYYKQVHHNDKQAGLAISNATNTAASSVIRFNAKKGSTESTSTAIHLHSRSYNYLPSSGIPNSQGCQVVGKADEGRPEYTKFCKAIGLISQSGSYKNSPNKVNGRIVIDRMYATDYLVNKVGYPQNVTTNYLQDPLKNIK